MKKFLLILFFCLIQTPICAVEEIDLEKEHINLDYFSNVYYGNKEDAPKALKLFSKKGLEFDNSIVNSVKINMLYSGHINYVHNKHIGEFINHEFVTVEPGITLKGNDNKTEASFRYNFTRNYDNYSDKFFEKISSLYISQKLTENQKIILGQYSRVPVSVDGGMPQYKQNFISKSQLGRTLGNVMSVGIRDIASYKYLDYDIGLYDSTRYMQNFGRGIDFTVSAMVKPLAGIKENKNNLKFGGSYNTGKYGISYSQYSLYTGFDRDKFHAEIEYANANGYNGIKTSRNKAEGLYTSISYDITPKLSVLARYDIFNPNTQKSNNSTKEYTIGFNYQLFKNMKLMINYIFSEGHNKPTSNSILFATRFII